MLQSPYPTSPDSRLLTGDLEMAENHVDEAAQFGPLRPRNMGGLWEEEAFAKSLIALMRGEYQTASSILEKTVHLAEELGNRMGYFWTRVHLGYVALRAGDLMEARSIFAETAQAFQKDGSTIGVIFTLEGLAGLSRAVGKLEHAARLIGWADGARLRILNPRPFLEQAHVDQIIAVCLARMAEAAFSDAYTEEKEITAINCRTASR